MNRLNVVLTIITPLPPKHTHTHTHTNNKKRELPYMIKLKCIKYNPIYHVFTENGGLDFFKANNDEWGKRLQHPSLSQVPNINKH